MDDYCQIPELQNLVREWSSYYPRPDDKLRMGFLLEHPRLTVTQRAAAHDFFYLSDEFSILFEPLRHQEKVFLLTEGPHDDPTKGARIPLLSTWSHLRRMKHGESSIQEAFAFFENRWWAVTQMSYGYEHEYRSIDTTFCPPIYWCSCNGGNDYFVVPNLDLRKPPFPFDKKHSIYHTYNLFTLFKEQTNSQFFRLVEEARKDKDAIGIIGDWLFDQDDPLAEYIQEIKLGQKRNLRELEHICTFIQHAKNDRAARLLLLMEIIYCTIQDFSNQVIFCNKPKQ